MIKNIMAIGAGLVLIIAIGTSLHYRSLNSHLKATISTLTDTNAELTLERNTYREQYTHLFNAIESQRELMAELQLNGQQIINNFSQFDRDIRGRVNVITRDLSKLATIDYSKLTCEEAIDTLRNTAIERSK